LSQLAIGLTIALVLLAVFFVVMVKQLNQIVSPDEALIISGRHGFRHVTGGGTIVMPIIEKAQRMYIGLRTLDVQVTDVLSKNRVPINVDATIQYKIGHDEEKIKNAARRFLGKKPEDVDEAMHRIFNGHLRTIIARLDAVEVFQDQEAFATQVVKLSQNDLGPLGLIVDSFVITRIHDANNYYSSLGAEEIANVLRNAQVARAIADRETRERRAEEELAARQSEIKAQTQQAEADRTFNVQTAGYKQEAETARATAEMAFQLKQAEIEQELALKNGAVEVERRKQEALAQEQAIDVAKQRTQAEVVVPANAEREATVARATAAAEARTIQAQAEATATKVTAEATAEQTRATRTAEAAGIEATGLATASAKRAQLLAEAEGEKKLAEARAANDSVNLQLELARIEANVRTEVGRAAADAMGKVGANTRIVQFSGGNSQNGSGNGIGNALFDTIGRIPEAMSQLNAKVDALSGRSASEWIDGAVQTMRGKTGALSRLANGDNQRSNTSPTVLSAALERDEETATKQPEEVVDLTPAS
jgi:flotillin